MKIVKNVFLVAFAFIIISCNGQDKSKEKPKTVHKEQEKGTNPKESVKVNKTYDAKGNLIKFDSTFTYYYTAKGRDSSKVVLDTVFNQFKSFFNGNYSSLSGKKFDEMFLNDSLFKYDFLNKDFFEKRFELNAQKMSEMFRQMDSLKNTFIKETKTEPPAKKKIKK